MLTDLVVNFALSLETTFNGPVLVAGVLALYSGLIYSTYRSLRLRRRHYKIKKRYQTWTRSQAQARAVQHQIEKIQNERATLNNKYMKKYQYYKKLLQTLASYDPEIYVPPPPLARVLAPRPATAGRRVPPLLKIKRAWYRKNVSKNKVVSKDYEAGRAAQNTAGYFIKSYYATEGQLAQETAVWHNWARLGARLENIKRHIEFMLKHSGIIINKEYLNLVKELLVTAAAQRLVRQQPTQKFPPPAPAAPYLYVLSNAAYYGPGVYKIGSAASASPTAIAAQWAGHLNPWGHKIELIRHVPDAARRIARAQRELFPHMLNKGDPIKNYYRAPLTTILAGLGL